MNEELEKIKEEANENAENLEGGNVGDTLTPSEADENYGAIEASENVNDDVFDNLDVEAEVENNNEESVVNNEEKMLTQSQVNELIGKARMEGRQAGRNEAMQELLERYGVNDDNELNDMFGKGQAYGMLNDDYNNMGGQYKETMAENALLKTKVNEGKWDDVKALLAYKGLDVTVENIEALIPTHQEWLGSGANMGANVGGEILTKDMAEDMSKNIGVNQINEEPPAKLAKLGHEPQFESEDNEKAYLDKLFGMNN